MPERDHRQNLNEKEDQPCFSKTDKVMVGSVVAGAGAAAMFWGRRNKGQ